MENNQELPDAGKNTQQVPPPVETNYPEHEQNPGPSEEAVYEENDKGGGQMLKWIIPAVLLILLICWFFFFRTP